MNVAPIKVYWHNPAPIFVARVNLASATYPIQNIPYDNVTVGSYTDLAADQFFTLGTAAGKDDYGRGRLRAAPTSTVLKVGRASEGYEDGQLSVVDNAWISVYPDFRVHAKIPVIGANYNDFKDTDIAVGDLTENPPPIANLGSDIARSIDADTGVMRAAFFGSGSIAVADGATIVTYAWNAGGGTFAAGTDADDDDVVIDFEPGVYWVTLTVTDDNGKSNTSRRLVLADDPADSLCVSGMQVQSISRSDRGIAARLRVLQDLPRSQYPDGGHILIFEDRDPAIYGEPDPASRDDQLFTGWHQSDNASARALETHLQRETILTCVDVVGRLDSLPGFPQRVEVPTEDDLTETGMNWGYMPAANMDKFMAYLLHWHSTAGGVADFYPSGTWDDYPFVLFDSGGATLYEQLQRQANRIVPDYDLMSDRFGALRVEPNPQFQNPEDRTAVTQNSITVQAWSEIDFTYNRVPRIHTTRGSALLTQTEWEIGDDGEKGLLSPVFAIAPGTAPGQGGREAKLGERLAQSQDDLNDCIGHHHAHSNARYGAFNVALNANADPWDFNPAAHTWVQLVITAAHAPQRGIDFETTRCLCQEVSIDFEYTEEGTFTRSRVTLEVETVGLPALTEVHEDALPVGTQPTPPYVPDFGLISGQELVAGIGIDGYIYRTSDFQTDSGSGGPTWDRVDTGIADTIYSWVVDPFSPGYIDGAGSINGWIVNDTDIYRVEDIFGATPSVTSVHTFATATSGASFHWRTIQASFGAFFAEGANPWLLCVSYYGDTSGHEGTWATYSTDGGATWATEVQVSAFSSLEPVPARYNPIGVYTSPKTPGFALTAAHIEATADELAPRIYEWAETTIDNTIVGGYYGLSTTHQTTTSGSPISKSTRVSVHPPADAVRVETTVTWSSVNTKAGGLGGQSTSMSTADGATIARVGDDNYVNPGQNSADAGSFSQTFTLSSGTDWPDNREQVDVTPPSTVSGSISWTITQVVNTTGGNLVRSVITFEVRVTEIELDDGTIYVPSAQEAAGFVTVDYGATWAQEASVLPGNAQAGSIHAPWPSNDDESIVYHGQYNPNPVRQFRLLRSGVDISPSDAGVIYGVNKGLFTIRAYDSDRTHLLLAGIGNETSADASDDTHGIFYSDNEGATWAAVVTPVADSGAPAGRPIFEAAFSGDDPAVHFYWGAENYISYTEDAGSTVDSRAGNLSSFGSVYLLGIAGGPSA